MTKLRLLLVTIAVMLVALSATTAFGADGHGRVVMFVLDRATIDDYKTLTTLHELKNSWGLMNTNTGGARNVENTHATIGAGGRLVATNFGLGAYNALENLERGEPAMESFKRRTGIDVEEKNVLHLGIPGIIKESRKLHYETLPGALGAILRANGLKTCVFGNADWSGLDRRPAVTIAMDDHGIVSQGDVSRQMLEFDTTFPGAFHTDYKALLEAYRSTDADLIILDLGDLSRLNEAQDDVLPSVANYHRGVTLERVNQLLGAVLESLDLQRDLLLVVTPTPAGDNMDAGDTLTPVVAAGPGFGEGMLTSPATRREGVVQNTDLAPTIINYFGLTPPVAMHGRPMTSIEQTGVIASLETLNQRISLNHRIRVPIIQTYMVFQIAIVALVILNLLVRNLHIARRFRLRQVLLLIMAFPAASLLVAAFPYRSGVSLVLTLLAAVLIVGTATVILAQRHPLRAFLFISLLTAAVILGDLLSGTMLQKYAILSYDPAGGSRYYGLGNEYMGILAGSAILASASFLSLARHRSAALAFVALFFALAVFVNANPELGANWGGTITTAVSFLVSLLLYLGVRFTWRTILVGGAVLGTLLAGTAIFDALRPAEQQSHIGRAVRAIFSGGIGGGLKEVSDLVARKVSMNYKLVRYTVWSRVFLVSLVAFAVMFFRPIGRMHYLQRNLPLLYKGAIGIVVASIVALIVNDSGIVAAATTMIFGAPPLLYYFLEDDHA